MGKQEAGIVKRSAGGKKDKSKPQGPIWPIIKRLLSHTRGHRGWILLTLLLIGCSTFLGLLPPWVIRYAVDDLILAGETELLWMAALGILLLAFLQGAINFSERYLMEWVGQRIVYRLRGEVFQHLNRLSFEFYDQARTGDIMSRVTADTGTINRFLGFGLVHLIGNVATIAGILIILLIWDFSLALLYLLILIPMFHAFSRYAFQVRPLFAYVRRHLGQISNVLQENLAGIRRVKLSAGENIEKEKFDQANYSYFQASLEAARVRALWMPYINFLIGIATALIVWYAGRGVIRGELSLGILVGFTSYIALLVRPIRQSGMLMGLVMGAAAGAERVFQVLDTVPEVKDKAGAVSLEQVKGRIEIKNLNYAYDETPVLQDINMTIDAGEVVALVGPTGTGKSTFLHLIPRFYELQEGSITLDGYDIRDIKLKNLRSHVGMMLQDTFIFDATIRDNIAYGVSRASNEEVQEVAKKVQLHDFIVNLPQGYNTPVGERGITLSGGQRQRLALARILMKDPAVLLLDEPTASIDVETESLMLEALQQVFAGRTVLVVAHRLWTVQRADRIVVMQDGRIVQEGKHQKLVEEHGPYRTIYDAFQRKEVGT